MVRRHNGSRRDVPAFQATGRIAGRDVTVVRLGDVPRFPDGGFAVWGSIRVEPVHAPESPGFTGAVPIHGYLIPASFRVEGFGFPLTYDVGFIGEGATDRYGVTYLSAGTKASDQDAATAFERRHGVDVADVSHAALVRLALRASKVHGFSYPPGTVYDPRTGAVVGLLKPGDRVPEYPLAFVGVVQKPGEHGKVFRLGKSPSSVLMFRYEHGDPVPEVDARTLTGKNRTGRRPNGDLSDEDLERIGRLYDEAYTKRSEDKPGYVRDALITETNGRLAYSRNTIRRFGVEAGKRGYRTKGLRKPRKKGRSK